MNPTFSLIHATARPDKWRKAHDAWRDTCTHWGSVEYILSIDKQDWDKWMQPEFTVSPPPVYPVVNLGYPCPAHAWNAAASHAQGLILITVADDWFPTRPWNHEILWAIPDPGKEYVIDTRVPERPDILMEHSILTKAYYDRYGYIFHPDYKGMYADWEFTDVAHEDGVVIPAPNLKFTHDHPDRESEAWDDIYERQNSAERLNSGMKLYAERKMARMNRQLEAMEALNAKRLVQT